MEGEVYNDDIGVRQRSNFGQLFSLTGTEASKRPSPHLVSQTIRPFKNGSLNNNYYFNGTYDNNNNNQNGGTTNTHSAISSDQTGNYIPTNNNTGSHNQLNSQEATNRSSLEQQNQTKSDLERQQSDQDRQALALIQQQRREREIQNGGIFKQQQQQQQQQQSQQPYLTHQGSGLPRPRGSFQQVYNTMQKSLSGIVFEQEQEQQLQMQRQSSQRSNTQNSNQQNSSMHNNNSQPNSRASKQSANAANVDIPTPPGAQKQDSIKLKNQISDGGMSLLQAPSRNQSFTPENMSKYSSLGPGNELYQTDNPQILQRDYNNLGQKGDTPSTPHGGEEEPWVQAGLGINVQRQLSNSSYDPQRSNRSESPINTNTYKKIIKQAEVHPYMIQASIKSHQGSGSPFGQSTFSQSPTYSPINDRMSPQNNNQSAFGGNQNWKTSRQPTMEITFSPKNRNNSYNGNKNQPSGFVDSQKSMSFNRNRDRPDLKNQDSQKQSSPRWLMGQNKQKQNTLGLNRLETQSASLKNVNINVDDSRSGDSQDSKKNTKSNFNQIPNNLKKVDKNRTSLQNSVGDNSDDLHEGFKRQTNGRKEVLDSNHEGFNSQLPSIHSPMDSSENLESPQGMPQVLGGLDSMRGYDADKYQYQSPRQQENNERSSSFRNSNSKSKQTGSDISLHAYRNAQDDGHIHDSGANEQFSLRNSGIQHMQIPNQDSLEQGQAYKTSSNSLQFNFQNKNSTSINSTVDTPQISPRSKQVRQPRRYIF